MQKRILIKETQRAWERFIVLFKGQYRSEQYSLYRNCIVVDISRQGACVKLPIDKNIYIGVTIFLKLLTKESQDITIEGEIVWIEQTVHAFIVGVIFSKLLNLNKLKI